MSKWNAEDYEKNSAAQQRWGEALIDRIAFQENERVLDLGCGDGKLSARIAVRVPTGCVVGVDKSGDMIRLAQEKYADRAPHLRFQVEDASFLSFEKTCFDVVFSNAALHWVLDHVPVLKGIHRCLAPQGRINLEMGGKGNAKHVIESMTVLLSRPEWVSYFTDFQFPYGFHSPDDYEIWLTETGLKPMHIELVHRDMVHTAEKFKSWIRTTWLPYTHRVPEDLRDRFIEDFADVYLEQCPLDSEGLVHVDMVRLCVEAVKES